MFWNIVSLFLISFYSPMCPINWTLQLYYRKFCGIFQYLDTFSSYFNQKSNNFVRFKYKKTLDNRFWLPRAYLFIWFR